MLTSGGIFSGEFNILVVQLLNKYHEHHHWIPVVHYVNTPITGHRITSSQHAVLFQIQFRHLISCFISLWRCMGQSNCLLKNTWFTSTCLIGWFLFFPTLQNHAQTASFPMTCVWSVNVMDGLSESKDARTLTFSRAVQETFKLQNHRGFIMDLLVNILSWLSVSAKAKG